VGILKNKGDRRWGGDSRKAAGSCHLIMGIIWKLHFKQTLETSWGWAVIWRSGRRGFVFLVGLDTHVMGGGRESIGPRKLNSFKTSKVFAQQFQALNWRLGILSCWWVLLQNSWWFMGGGQRVHSKLQRLALHPWWVFWQDFSNSGLGIIWWS